MDAISFSIAETTPSSVTVDGFIHASVQIKRGTLELWLQYDRNRCQTRAHGSLVALCTAGVAVSAAQLTGVRRVGTAAGDRDGPWGRLVNSQVVWMSAGCPHNARLL